MKSSNKIWPPYKCGSFGINFIMWNLRILGNPSHNTFRNKIFPNIAKSNWVASLHAIKTCNNRLFWFFNRLFFWKGFEKDFENSFFLLCGLNPDPACWPKRWNCLVKGSTCAPLHTSVPLRDPPQEPAKKQSGAAAADRTPTPKSVTESPNTKRTRTVQILSHSKLYNSQA